MNASLIASLSVILTTTVIGNAFYQKKQFYPSVVYLTKSNASLAVIYVQAFVLVILFGKLVRKIFFGQLRAAEFEHLMERSWYAVTETCLAFTMFRDDLSPKFVALFTLLLFLKSFHWLAEDRVDYMERSPVITWLFHIRIVSLLLLLSLLDCGFIGLAYQSTVSRGASVQLVFGFEYAILLTAVAYVLVKYVLHTVDLQREAPWENKAVHLLHTELLIGFVKVILYMVFTLIMVKIHTLPLFAIRPMYLALRSFKKALSDVILSRRAIHNMNTLYPTVSAEELANTDSVCIICREEMTAAAGAKKLPCNHVFHALCLRSWFQRQQTCPTCRMDILRAPAPAQPPPQQHPQPQPQQQHPQQQQQQQQQPPPPPQPNMGGLLPPFVWPFPPPAPAAAGAAPAPPGAGVAPAAQPGAAGFAAPLAPGAQLPAFHFEQFMMLPAMPPPPADLAALTEQQLLALEQHERSGIEARIRCLRDIGTLLDAAVTMMDQYSRAATLSTRSTPTAAGAGVAAAAGAGVAAAAGAGVAAAAGAGVAAAAGAGVAAAAGAGRAAAAGSASAGADAARPTGEAGEGVVAEATAETAAGVTGGAVAGAAGGAVAGATGGSVAGASGRAVAGVAGGAVAGATGGAVAKATGGEVAGATGGAVAGVTGGAVAGATGGAVAGAAEGAVAGAAEGAVAEAAGGAAVRQITPEASSMARTAIDGLMTEPTQGPERQLTPQEELRRRRVQHFQQQ